LILSELLQFLTPSPRIKIVLPGAPNGIKLRKNSSFIYTELSGNIH